MVPPGDLWTATWQDIATQVALVAKRWEPRNVFGIPRGGHVPAAMLATLWGTQVLTDPEPGCLMLDDLVDSGRTMDEWLYLFGSQGVDFDALYRKPTSPETPHREQPTLVEGWVVFPWERESSGPEDAVVRLLQWVGENPAREGLLDTPARVTKAWRELCEGYQVDPAQLLATQFEQEGGGQYGGMVVLRAVPFHSMCEHHLLPFSGHATVAYIPGDSGRIVGLSKLARLVEAYARRLQVQERMTLQVVEALEQHLEPKGSACVITAHHSCMSLRGVRKDTGGMVTSELRGAFWENAAARAELLGLHAS